MDWSRVRVTDWVAAIAGFILFFSLFISWYASNGDDVTGWESLAIIDKIVMITGLLGLVLPLIVAAKARGAAQTGTFLLVVFGVLSVICIVVRMLDVPEFDRVDNPVTLQAGIWLAIVAAVVTTAAAFVSLGARRSPPARVAARA